MQDIETTPIDQRPDQGEPYTLFDEFLEDTWWACDGGVSSTLAKLFFESVTGHLDVEEFKFADNAAEYALVPCDPDSLLEALAVVDRVHRNYKQDLFALATALKRRIAKTWFYLDDDDAAPRYPVNY